MLVRILEIASVTPHQRNAWLHAGALYGRRSRIDGAQRSCDPCGTIFGALSAKEYPLFGHFTVAFVGENTPAGLDFQSQT
jgi:hypothetical protein